MDIATAGAAAGAGVVSDLMDIALHPIKRKQALKDQQQSLQQQNNASMDMWLKTNYSAQKEQMEKAGINPGLMYGMGGGAGGSTGGAAGALNVGESKGMDIAGAAQLKLINAQAKQLEAETKKTEQETRLAGMNTIIQEISGWEKSADYEDRYAPVEDSEGFIIAENKNRTQRRTTEMTELQGREGQARNIAEQYANGNMRKMSQAQLDDMLKSIGVKEGTIKKIDLENKLTELDLKLQEKFGMGKDAKGWIEMGTKLILQLLLKK